MRRQLLWLCGTCCVLAALPPARAADFTARQITKLLFDAKTGSAPDLSGKDLSYLDLSDLHFKGAVLIRTNLFGADLSRSDLSFSDLRGARLDRSMIIDSDFSGADLEGASILRPAINISLEKNRSKAPNFARANLRGVRIAAMMDGVNFREADLSGANFGPYEARADLSSMPASVLRGCDFSAALLIRANLMWAKLRFSKFVDADLEGANLAGADLAMTDLSGANLSNANVTGADFDGARLDGVRGLENAYGVDQAFNLQRSQDLSR